MKITISDQNGIDRVVISNARTWRCQGNMLHLNKQHTGEWHLIYGDRPVPHFGLLKAIEFTDMQENTATVEFSMHTSSVRRPCIFVYKDASHPYIQFEEDLSGTMIVYLTRNLMSGRPATLRWEI